MRHSMLLALSCLAACGGDDPAAAPTATACVGRPPAFVNEWLLVTDGCDTAVRLAPVARIGGAWVGGGRTGACRVADAKLACPTDAGDVLVELDGPTATVSFRATRSVDIEALGLDGDGVVAGAESWLSNGFQSWSESGVVALAPPSSDDALQKALEARGDAEVLREGRDVSWTLSYVGSAKRAFFAGATTAARWKPWVSIGRGDGDMLHIRAAAGGSGERVGVSEGSVTRGETFYLAIGLPFADYAARLGSRRATHPVAAPIGWNSWYELWDSIDEPAARDNAKLAKAALAPVVPAGQRPFLVVDDGWQRAWGDWQPDLKRFPSGLDGLAKDMAADGMRFGVWLAPLIASEKSDTWKAHPDWFVPGAIYPHPKNGDMHVLDVTQPDAAAHLKAFIAQLVAWGVELVKIDFLFAGTWEGSRHEPVTGMQAYTRAMELIRSAAGEQTLVVAVGAPPLPSIAHVDGWRMGPDIALEGPAVAWPFVAHEARAAAAHYPFCLATLCDADPPLLRKLTEEEVRAGAAVVAFSGGGFFLSDDLRKLDPARLAWGLDPAVVAASIGGRPAEPQDLFPSPAPAALSNPVVDLVARSTSQIVPRVWRLPGGGRAAWNASDEAITVDGVAVPAHATRPLP